jgi:hypothetical protein
MIETNVRHTFTKSIRDPILGQGNISTLIKANLVGLHERHWNGVGQIIGIGDSRIAKFRKVQLDMRSELLWPETISTILYGRYVVD